MTTRTCRHGSSNPRFAPRVRSSLALTAAVVVSLVLVVLAVGAPASARAARGLPPAPQAPVVVPEQAEGFQPYVPQTSCAPFVKKGVKKFRRLMLDTYRRGSDGGAARACAIGGRSEHKEGRAWDWMLDADDKKDRKAAKRALRWLLAPGPGGEKAANARRLGIMYVMWDGRIWGSYDGRWRPISPGSHQHRDHVHFSFSWTGARGTTSFWTGKVRKVDYGPCPVYAGQPAVLRRGPNRTGCGEAPLTPPQTRMPLQWFGSSGKPVGWAQKKLGVERTGAFDKRTRRAVRDFQADNGLPVTGALDQPTWARLRPASVTRPEPPGQAAQLRRLLAR